ncbi:MAG: hypothetical protein JWO03_732 [Bacteroidetes bacterium]|nr:hypothetical protein [Bacteroidota bacterium]
MSKLKSFAAVILVALALVSCHDKSKFLVNTWKLDDQKFDKPIPDEGKNIAEAFLKKQREALRVTYNADGTYDHSDGINASHGTWKFNKDQTQLTCQLGTGQDVVYDVIELTKDKFVSSAKMNGADKVTYYMSPASGAPAPTPSPATETASSDTTKKAQ